MSCEERLAADVLILGGGFTGGRVARRLARRGLSVTATHRARIDFTQPQWRGRLSELATAGCVVLHSVPTLPDRADELLLGALVGRARRVVYLSTTSVYGDAHEVNERTPIRPVTERAIARARTEAAVLSGPWEALVLRPAAIYGPGRGVLTAMREGRYTLLGEGSNVISRIHVDDLARIAEAALLSELTGAYPVADRHPCSSREIAEYCSGLFGLPMPRQGEAKDVPESRRANRRVDGSAICGLLGVELEYPSYRDGIRR